MPSPASGARVAPQPARAPDRAVPTRATSRRRGCRPGRARRWRPEPRGEAVPARVREEPSAAPAPARRTGRTTKAPPRGTVDRSRFVLAAAAVLLALAVALPAARVRRRVRPIIALGEPLLPDDTDLLRELDPAHRARVHDHRRGHHRAPARQRGDETFFLTGTDEHASKVYRVAEEQGLDAEDVRGPDRRGELAPAAGPGRSRAGLLHPDD